MKKTIRLALVAALAGLAAPALAATTTATFSVSAAVMNTCQIQNVTNLSFGNYVTVTGGNLDSTASFDLRCNRGTAYTIGLSNGGHFGLATGYATARAMTDGTNFLAYQLFSDTNRTVAWGNTVGTDTVGGTAANSSANTMTIYGRVPANQDVPGGTATGVTYNDATVTITVNY